MRNLSTDEFESIVKNAVQAALDSIDAELDTNKSTGACGDKLANELHQVIESALKDAAGYNYIPKRDLAIQLFA